MLAVVAAACSLLLSAPPSVAAAACPGATLLPTSTDAAAIDKATLCLVNQVRAAHHLHSLRANRYRQNIAWGTESFASPEHIVQEWMASRPHRAVILTKLYRDAGVAVEPAIPGVLGAGRAGATYAMEFGVRKF